MSFYVYWQQGYDLSVLDGPLSEHEAKQRVETLLQNESTVRVIKGHEVEIVPVSVVTKVEFKRKGST